MVQAAHDPSSTPAQDLQYVGFWLRFVACIIDSILIVAVAYPLLKLIYGRAYTLLGSTELDQLSAALSGETVSLASGAADASNASLLEWLIAAVAFIAFWIARQATPGKMLFRARIVDARTGGKPSVGQLIGRYFAYYVSLLPLALGFLWIAFDRRKQGWHDKLAGTVVVRPHRSGEPVRFGAS